MLVLGALKPPNPTVRCFVLSLLLPQGVDGPEAFLRGDGAFPTAR